MKKQLRTIGISALILSGTANAQSSCDSLQILAIQYAPFTDTAMQVIVMNETSELFGYPQFSLINEAGDTLVTESLNFFGIGWNAPSVHRMDLRPGQELPETPFTGTLSLTYFTGDGTPTCIFPIEDEPLCPQETCTPFQVFLYNNAPVTELVTDVFPWNIMNEENEIVASGSLQIDALDQQQAMEEACLPPGQYMMNIEQNGSAGITFTIGVTQNAFMQNGPMDTLMADGSITMPFTYYPVCVGIGMSIEESEPSAPLIALNDRMMQISDRNGSQLGRIMIFDPAGRAMRTITTSASIATIDLSGEAAGVYLLRSMDGKWRARKFILE